MLWDIATVNEQVAINNNNNYTDERMLGVRSSPLFSIPFLRILFSVLHGEIGVGGVLVKLLEAFVDCEIESVSHQEYQLRQLNANNTILIETLRAQKKVWTESVDGGRLLAKKRRRIKKLQEATPLSEAEGEEKGRLEAEVVLLVKSRDLFSKQIAQLLDQIKSSSEKLATFTSKRRSGEESVYTEVDRIFKKHGANRSSYFGRAFQGVDIRKIMDKSDKLFGEDGEIRQCLLSHVAAKSTSAEERSILKDKTNDMCEDIGLAMKLWDGVFSYVHKSNPDEAHCKATQNRINNAMAHMRKMGVSITPKMHGMEKHVVNQMRATRGGIGRLVEHWIEHYHQVGYRFDVAYDRVGSTVEAAKIRARSELRSRHPQVQLNKKHLQEFGKRKKNKVRKSEEQQQIKVELRNKAIEIFESKYLDAATISEKMDQMEEDEEEKELAELEARLFGTQINF
jgi:hypothetical protein